MSEESGAPKPSKLKLSSSKSQPEKPDRAPTPSQDASPVKPITAFPPQAAAVKVEPQASKPKLSSTPPPLTQRPATRISEPVAQNVNGTVRQMPSPPPKDDPLGSILIIAALLLILAAAAGGIWYLLSSDQTPVNEEEAILYEPSPTNPVERAKATIEAVPERNLDPISVVEEVEVVVASEIPKASVQVTEVLKSAPPKSFKKDVSIYLQNVHIGGIRTGARARIMLDGRNYDINDTVDQATGLIFIGTRDQKLHFKDLNGIVYVKSF